MSKPEFVYTTYIDTTAEQLWQALTDPEFTRRWFAATTLDTDWAPGSPIVWDQNGVLIADPEQVVLVSEPPHRLAYTWHTFSDEWAKAIDFDETLHRTIAAERRSRVTFTIEPEGAVVRLTVVHDDFPEDSAVLPLVCDGWPRLVSDLKTLLETGETLPGAP